MQATAKLRYIRTSPRKMRIVADQVRGMAVPQALNTLHFLPQTATEPVYKTISSAVHNLLDQNQGERVDENDLYVQAITVDGAPTIKRFRPVSRGRGHRILKRNSHLTVVVALRGGDEASDEA